MKSTMLRRSLWILLASILGVASASALIEIVRRSRQSAYAAEMGVSSQSPGQPDATFGAGGVITLNIRGDDMAEDVAIQPDGKIVVVGGGDLVTPK
jgi:hypothetical protein